MKKLIFMLIPASAFAGGPAASARNPELLAFEGIVIGLIILILGTEYGWKWLQKKISERKHRHEADGGSGNVS